MQSELEQRRIVNMWKCPKCGFEECYEPDDDDIQQLFNGTFSSQCWECEETIALFYEDEL